MRTGTKLRRGAREAIGPGPVYLDASALVKLYVPEAESDELNRRLRGQRAVTVSDLSVTEVVSALARRRREGLVEADIVARIHRAVLNGFESGLFLRASLVPEVHREAERLLLALEDVAVRAADALHLALAAASGAGTLVTFDRRLAEAAHRIGLRKWP